jgi:hypothetical protein
MPRVRRQGYGLGNELVPWARAFLASQVLNARLLPPAFGLNRRSYWLDFNTGPDDWLYNRALEYLLPTIEFSERDYLAHGGGDVVQALRSFTEAHGLQGRKRLLLVTEGLWGGFHHIEAARDFIRGTLYNSRYAPRNLCKLRERTDRSKVVVAMHVRLGDFVAPVAVEDYRRVANAALPMEWFCNLASCLQRHLGDDWQLLLVSDGRPEQLRELLDRFPCVVTGDLSHRDCSDLLALANADLLICSASTYSAMAAFLSDSPYVWFRPNLFVHPEGCLSTHGPGIEHTRIAVRQYALDERRWISRCVAVGMDGEIPTAVIELAIERRDARGG